MGDDSDIRVQLARMEGKLDLSNLRHDQHDQRFTAVDTRLNSHGERIGGLEKRETERTSEQRGLAKGAKLLWAAVGAVPIAIGAAVLRALGA